MPPEDASKQPAHVADYAAGPRRIVPGFDALHHMMNILLAELVPPTGTSSRSAPAAGWSSR